MEVDLPHNDRYIVNYDCYRAPLLPQILGTDRTRLLDNQGPDFQCHAKVDLKLKS